MAAKKKQPQRFNFGKNSAEKRRTTQTKASLLEQIEIVKRIQEGLMVAAKVMETQKIESIIVDGSTKFERGIESLTEYIKHVRVAIAGITLGSDLGGIVKK